MRSLRMVTAAANDRPDHYLDPEYHFSTIDVDGHSIQRILCRTHVIRPGEDLAAMMHWYLQAVVQPTDVVFIGQKAAAIAEGRCILLSQVHPRLTARLLARMVRRSPHGLGLRRPETMEMAIREVGLLRITTAAAAGLMDRVRGRSGSFYRVAGHEVASIDGPGPSTIAPFDRYVVLTPRHPGTLCRTVSRVLGARTVIVDANDLGCEVLGSTSQTFPKWVPAALRDNPMGQGGAATPIGILRRQAQHEAPAAC